MPYAFAGHAEAMEQMLAAFGISNPLVFGWSLGGHVAREMSGRGMAPRGMMTSGTPPVRAEMESLLAGRAIAASMTVPFAAVNGEEDPVLKPKFLDTRETPTLRSHGAQRIAGAGHSFGPPRCSTRVWPNSPPGAAPSGRGRCDPPFGQGHRRSLDTHFGQGPVPDTRRHHAARRAAHLAPLRDLHARFTLGPPPPCRTAPRRRARWPSRSQVLGDAGGR